MKLLELSELPSSTYYYWRKRMHRLYTLCVWAGWYKASREGVIPTMAAIWGTTDFASSVFRHRRSGEVVISPTSPGTQWEVVKVVEGSTRGTTDRLPSVVNLTGLAVHQILMEELGKGAIRDLLHILPVSGKYQGEFWSDDEEDLARAVAAAGLKAKRTNSDPDSSQEGSSREKKSEPLKSDSTTGSPVPYLSENGNSPEGSPTHQSTTGLPVPTPSIEPEKLTGKDKARAAQLAVITDSHSLRDLRRSTQTDADLTTIRLASGVLSNRAIRAGVKALENRAAIVAKKALEGGS